MAISRAVFLDRDGTLNFDPGYLRKVAELRILPGVVEGLKLLKKNGFLLVVISNQSGIRRGLIDPSELPKIHTKLNILLGPESQVDHFYYCPHRPEEGCECRKPKVQLLEQAAALHGIHLRSSYMVGDKDSDLLCGRNAGCKGVALVRTGYGADTEKSIKSEDVDFVGDNLLAVAHWIVESSASTGPNF